jgi:amino acid permease
MIARTALITGKTTFAEQWAKLIGEGSSWIPTLVLIAVCFGNTIEYLCFVADLLAGSLPAFGLPLSRTLCTWLFALFPTLPLCFLKDLSALAPTSLLGLFSVIYLVIVIVLRSFDGSYAPGGHFYVELPVASKPSVPQGHLFQFGLPSLVLINALAMGFLPHYNGCKYYRELEDHNPKRFLKCTMAGMGAAAFLYSIAMLAGYRSFGSATQSVITESYSSDDLLINIARVAIGSSILFSFPIMFSGLREAFLQMLSDVGKIECKEVWKQDSITFVMVVLIAFLTSILTDAGLVVGLVGPICGCAAIFLVPCTLYAAALKWRVSHLTADGHASREASDKNMSGQIFLARALTVLGVFLMVGGVYATFAYPG